GEIIEHGDNGNPPSVRVGDGGTLVSAKVYQDIYHQVTGRTEQIRKRYSKTCSSSFQRLSNYITRSLSFVMSTTSSPRTKPFLSSITRSGKSSSLRLNASAHIMPTRRA